MMILEIGKIEHGRLLTAGYSRHGHKRLRRTKNGFTLIELLCVIAIISILITISVPTLTKTARNFYFRNKTKQIEALLHFLKKKAVIENRAYKFSIDFSENSYAVYTKKDESYSGQFEKKHDSLTGPRRLSSGLFFKTESMTKQTEDIVFYERGNITPSQFYIHDNKRHTAKLTTTSSGQILLEFL